MVGQLQPGFFRDAKAFTRFVTKECTRYSTLAHLKEWKTLGSPDMSDMSRKAVQKLAVRADASRWEEVVMNLQLCSLKAGGDATPKARWVCHCSAASARASIATAAQLARALPSPLQRS